MEAPFVFSIYHGLRSLFSPEQRTGPYLVTETIVVTAAISAGAYALGALVAIPTAVLLGAVFVTLRLGLVPKDNWDSEPHVLDLTIAEVAVLGLLTGATVGVAQTQSIGPFVGNVSVHAVVALVHATYWAFVWAVGMPYGGDRRFHTNDYSPNWDTWVRASLALEKGHNHFEADRDLEAYHRWSEAESLYRRLGDEEEERNQREAARYHAEAAAEFQKAAFDDPRHAHIHYELADEFLDHAREELSTVICDGCGETFATEDTFRFLDDANHTKTRRCESCAADYRKREQTDTAEDDGTSTEHTNQTGSETTSRDRGSVDGSTASTNRTASSTTDSTSSRSRSSTSESSTSSTSGRSSSRSRSSTSSTSSSSSTTSSSSTSSSTSSGADSKTNRDGTGDTSRRNERSQQRVDDDDDMSVPEAKDVLDLDSGFSSDDLTRAYRTKVKEAHPDAGGSDEEFIRVKDAQQTLKEYVRRQGR